MDLLRHGLARLPADLTQPIRPTQRCARSGASCAFAPLSTRKSSCTAVDARGRYGASMEPRGRNRRLIGLLREKPWKRGFFYRPDSPATRQAHHRGGLTAVSVEPPGAVARRGLVGRAGNEPPRRPKANRQGRRATPRSIATRRAVRRSLSSPARREPSRAPTRCDVASGFLDRVARPLFCRVH